jgi:hypothetical protein
MSLFFFFTKSDNRRAEQVLSVDSPVGGEEDVGKGYNRVNVVQILCRNICNRKMRAAETIPEMEMGSR